MPKQVPGQMGPCYSLSDDKTCGIALDAILEKDGAANLIGELHRRMRRHNISDTENPIDVRTTVLMRRQGILDGLREAIKSGIADSYTFHFAATALAYSMELEKLNPGFFDSFKFHNGYEDELKTYIDNLIEKSKELK
jgi:hypothetical protein